MPLNILFNEAIKYSGDCIHKESATRSAAWCAHRRRQQATPTTRMGFRVERRGGEPAVRQSDRHTPTSTMRMPRLKVEQPLCRCDVTPSTNECSSWVQPFTIGLNRHEAREWDCHRGDSVMANTICSMSLLSDWYTESVWMKSLCRISLVVKFGINTLFKSLEEVTQYYWQILEYYKLSPDKYLMVLNPKNKEAIRNYNFVYLGFKHFFCKREVLV